MWMLTSADGCEFRTTVKVAVWPPSDVLPEIAETVTPTVSLSLIVTVPGPPLAIVYAPAVRVTITVSGDSAMKSLIGAIWMNWEPEPAGMTTDVPIAG